jgi:hypothetical protein
MIKGKWSYIFTCYNGICSNIRRLHEQLNEEKERLRRAHNILLMGIPETEDGLQQAADTMNLILPNIRVTIVNQRVGLIPTTNPRPLRIFLSNAAEVRTALNQSKLLKTNPSFRNISPKRYDETPARRKSKEDDYKIPNISHRKFNRNLTKNHRHRKTKSRRKTTTDIKICTPQQPWKQPYGHLTIEKNNYIEDCPHEHQRSSTKNYRR